MRALTKRMRLTRVRSNGQGVVANDAGFRGRPDARIVRALEAIAARPAERWSVAKLAKIAGLSRAAFARRFAAEVGTPPLHHLAALRMDRVAELLVTSDAAIAVIAAEVGYATEFALSRAFHRHMGEPPGIYRRRIRAAGLPSAPRCLAA
jgi:transcriptional regulator GlxA family with amidase domain